VLFEVSLPIHNLMRSS